MKIWWELIEIIPDTFVNRLDFLVLEGRLSNNKGVQNDANGPDIDLEGVAIILVKQDFGCNIVWSTANGPAR